MQKLCAFLLVGIIAVATALPQRRPQPSQSTPSTTGKPAPYPASGYRPGRAFDLPTEKKAEIPAPSYGPPADKYGPPEYSTTPQPEQKESPTDAVPEASPGTGSRTPNKLEPGFYFIQLPSGLIQRVSLLTDAPANVRTDDKAIVEGKVSTDDEEVVEEVELVEPVTPASPSIHVQPITRRTIEVWPPQQTKPLIEVQPAAVQNRRFVDPFVRSQALIQTIEPVVYIQPNSYSYTSQYRSW